jgi:hypothetical protein
MCPLWKMKWWQICGRKSPLSESWWGQLLTQENQTSEDQGHSIQPRTKATKYSCKSAYTECSEKVKATAARCSKTTNQQGSPRPSNPKTACPKYHTRAAPPLCALWPSASLSSALINVLLLLLACLGNFLTNPQHQNLWHFGDPYGDLISTVSHQDLQ